MSSLIFAWFTQSRCLHSHLLETCLISIVLQHFKMCFGVFNVILKTAILYHSLCTWKTSLLFCNWFFLDSFHGCFPFRSHFRVVCLLSESLHSIYRMWKSWYCWHGTLIHTYTEISTQTRIFYMTQF